MDAEAAREFAGQHHRAVVATRRRNGGTQMSPVLVTVDGDGHLAISSTESAAKVKNLRRDPRVSLCLVNPGWFGEWMQVDGTAEVVALPEAMELLVDYYRGVAGEHPDWDEYRQAMEREGRVLVRVTIERAGPDVKPT